MIKWIETTGRSEEDAISAALFQLGLDRDDVSVEVIERAKSGFLGFGSNPAKVRVSYEVEDGSPKPMMEDLLEEIVGDIWDEDEEEELPFQQLPDGSYEVSGDMDIDDLFEDFDYYNRHFESESSTVGGWAMEMLEHLPEPGEVFEYDGFTVQVLEVDEQRVTRLRVTFDRSRSSMEAKDNDD